MRVNIYHLVQVCDYRQELKDRLFVKTHQHLSRIWGGVNFSVPPSSEHFFIRNYFKCYEPRENIIAYCFTTFKTTNDEGFVITINGIYTKKGYNEPVFLPYQSAFPKFSAFWNSAKKIIKDFENKELQEKELIEKFSKTLLNEQLPVPPTERSQNIFSRVLLWRIQESSKFKFAKS